MPRILVADDHDGTRGILKVLLQGVRDGKFAAIELNRQISRLSPDTAIVIFSFYDMPELIAAARAAGVHRVATKSISSSIVVIEDVLRSPSNRLISRSEPVTQPGVDPPKENLD
jgi:hypothetical protein